MFSQAIKAKTLTRSAVQPWMLILAGSFWIALCAKISIPLPFTPIPLTCQTLAILLLGVTLGSKQALCCTLLYLFEGMVGLPVLANGAIKHLAFFGLTAGYIYSMPLLAWIAGYTASSYSLLRNVSILSLACFVNLLIGSLALTMFGFSWQAALSFGFLPFIAGEGIKILCLIPLLKFQRNH